jgi:membrane-bound serine protease (ClpP class)
MIDVSSPWFPNLLYLSLVAGFWLASLAVITPGTGFYELFAFIALGSAGIGLFYLLLNVWAFLLLALAVILFVLSLFLRKWDEVLLGASAVMLSLGSVFLFRSPNGGPAVNPFLAGSVSLMTLGFYWFAIRKMMQAQRMHSQLDPWVVMGQIGEVRSKVDPYGTVYVGGELWSAFSDHPIMPGEKVRIQDREGLILHVVPMDQPTQISKEKGE